MKVFQSFMLDEDGAVTVDWVVLTAAVVLLGVAVASTLTDPVNNKTTEIATVITNAN